MTGVIRCHAPWYCILARRAIALAAVARLYRDWPTHAALLGKAREYRLRASRWERVS